MRWLCVVGLLAVPLSVHADANPRSLDPELTITLFAENPQLVTPTGIDTDDRGRVWAIECNTHFPPKDYQGHPTDRILILTDADNDGRADEPKVFLDGLRHTMSVACRPVWMEPIQLDANHKPGKTQVFVATRREILLLEDHDGDDVCDAQTRLAWLDTRGDYPHNGLAGFAFDGLGWLYFGFGENLGEAYTLTCRGSGAEGKHAPIQGGAEGGNVYRMRPDGTEMEAWATGFWNPHASCFDAFGRMYTVDNDPDSRPPCRLMHVIHGGDYGYKFRNGRKGLHPFTAWNGELPGTLPMLAGTGEAPSGILAYEHDQFPKKYLGNLIVTSWGDHRIDRFELKSKGASFESVAEPFIVGGEEFRPVGIALAPDGSLFCTDWVKRDYQVHGHGRIWKIHRKGPIPESDVGELLGGLKSPWTPVRRLEARALSKSQEGRATLKTLVMDQKSPVRQRLEALWALAIVPESVERIALLEQPEILKAVEQSLDDEVSLQMLELAELPQISFLKRDHADSVGGDSAADGSVNVDRQLYAVMRSTPTVLRTKTAGANSAGVMFLIGIGSRDPFVSSAAMDEMARIQFPLPQIDQFDDDIAVPELANWVVYARRRNPDDVETLKQFLAHPSPLVRRSAVQWASEERLEELRDEVQNVLTIEPMTTDLFLATLAGLELLEGKSPQDFDKTPAGKYVVPLLQNSKTSDTLRVQCLKLLPAGAQGVSVDDLIRWSESDNSDLSLESIRTLTGLADPKATQRLLTAAEKSRPGDAVHSDAIAGLATAAKSTRETREALLKLLQQSKSPVDRGELIRSLRGVAGQDEVQTALIAEARRGAGGDGVRDWADQLALAFGVNVTKLPTTVVSVLSPRPASAEDWSKRLLEETDGDAARGRLVFFHPDGPGCVRCHTIDGRGGEIGPNLTRIGGSLTKEKLIESILLPSREVAPQFTSWSMTSLDGKVYNGMIVHENEGKTVLGDLEGKLIELKTADVEERVPQKTSVMPEKLADRMTVQEFIDLTAFLQSLK
jgi:putative membrane-bound dehydrogenase-like protein